MDQTKANELSKEELRKQRYKEKKHRYYMQNREKYIQLAKIRNKEAYQKYKEERDNLFFDPYNKAIHKFIADENGNLRLKEEVNNNKIC